MPLLGCATVALIGGFALLNQGLYETIGRGWYQVANARREPVTLISWRTPSRKRWASWTCWTSSSRTISSGLPRFVRRVAGKSAAGRVQAVLHDGLAPSDLCIPSAGKAAGRDDHRFLESPRSDPRAGSRCVTHLRRFGDRAPAEVAAIGADTDQGAEGPTAAHPGNDWSLDHSRLGP